MRPFAMRVDAVDADLLVTGTVRGGMLDGRQLAEKARPIMPPGTKLRPTVGDLIWAFFREEDPPSDLYYIGLVSPGDAIEITETKVLLKGGGAGVARLGDAVVADPVLVALLTAIKADLVTLFGFHVGAPIAGAVPTDAGTIREASAVVESG